MSPNLSPDTGRGAVDGAILVRELELTDSAAPLDAQLGEDAPRYRRARLLVRIASEPVGFLDVELPINAAALGTAVLAHFGAQIASRLENVGVSATIDDHGLRLIPSERSRLSWLLEREQVLKEAPRASVVVCTRNRSEGLARTLAAVMQQRYPNFEVVVVDNAPLDQATFAVADQFSRNDDRVRYVLESRPGLAWARNAGLGRASGEIIAFLDDDEIPDRYWIAELARGFSCRRDVAAVGGLIVPAELATPAQRAFEAFGGHSKGRGFEREIFDSNARGRQHPLYPLPPFAAGGNMAFRRAALEGIGGFDIALGAGTPTRGGEDTAALCDVMLKGQIVVWQPSAFVYHFHYQNEDEAAAQLFGYGAGLTAFYMRALMKRPSSAFELLHLAPRALKDLVDPNSLRNGGLSSRLPPRLRRVRRRGMVVGPWAYLQSTRIQRKKAESFAPLTGPDGQL